MQHVPELGERGCGSVPAFADRFASRTMWEDACMTGPDMKAELRGYLQSAREAMLWKLDGLSEYDVRRPVVPTGTNLLGLVKHLAGVEAGYFGETFGRPFPEPFPWLDD